MKIYSMFHSKKMILLLVLFIGLTNVYSQSISEINNLRSDTIDVLNYDIFLDFVALPGNSIQASCKVDFVSKMNNVNGISLDLLSLSVDSVKSSGALLSYTYNDTLLRVSFSNPMNQNETGELEVYYHGTPTTDASGFGGFYFQGSYAYNLGVGFAASPHNYGRVWHPCFDNFVERATYQVTVVSSQDKTAYSNGYIVNESVGPNNENIRTWKIDEAIPSYLACVGVADYAEVKNTYTSEVTGNIIPISLAARAVDTIKMKNSFIHLPDAIATYENRFGPYRWNKVGYAIVPFNGGAMEHATCIMYPTFAISGNLQYETMMAHELAHHWWGDLVTCKTAEDMWINEGLASYCEPLFLERVYGHDDYILDLKTTHRTVIQRAHYDDGGFLSISGVPHDATYGTHTYSKAAVQMHNLRTYLGDTDFFIGLNYIQDHYQYNSIDAAEFRDALNFATGKSTTTFFDNYIFNPGFNGFEVDSFVVTPQGTVYNVQVYIQQKLFHAPEMFEDVPLAISFIAEDWNSVNVKEIISGEHYSFTTTLPFAPKTIFLNRDYSLLNAVTGEELKIKGDGSKIVDFSYSYLNYTQASEDSSLVRIDHFRMAPDPIENVEMAEHYVISPDRYWKVDGIWSNSLIAKSRFFFNAMDVSSGNLDNGLMTTHDGVEFNEDSLVLLWRSNQSDEWSVYDNFTVFPLGSKIDGSARIEIFNLKKGEYAFGFRKKAGYTQVNEIKLEKVKVYPNPTKDILKIDFGELKVSDIEIVDNTGKTIEKYKINHKKWSISTEQLPAGMYQISMYQQGRFLGRSSFVKE